ncbi:MAG TPA: phosphatase PAP2 family protein [Stellaceae bacterium]|nr:phosphatase PAP2 family protein [Stellaceae bacterium]
MAAFPLFPGDMAIFHAVNGFAGHFAVDHLVKQAEENTLLRGTLYLTIYWGLWFWPSPRQAERRKILLDIMVAIVATVVIARVMAVVLPFRVRPIYTDGIGFQPTAFPVGYQLVNWSSFPSDTAAFFFAMSIGFWSLSRSLSIAAMAYCVTYICLPRLYLGLHWPSDLVVGCLVGAAVPMLVMRSAWIRRAIAVPLYECSERFPAYFYAGLFLVTSQMAPLFNDVRVILNGVAMIAHHFGLPSTALLLPLGAFGIAVLALLAYAIARSLRSGRGGGHRVMRLPSAPPLPGDAGNGAG